MLMERRSGCLAEPLTDRRWTPEEVWAQVARRGSQLDRAGLDAGDRVFLHSGNRLEFFADLLAVWAAGGCAIPLDAGLTPSEVATIAGAAEPRFSLWPDAADSRYVTELAERGVKILEAPRESVAEPEDLRATLWNSLSLDRDALILFTSGTTGEPKGVVHTHRSLRARWFALRECLGVAPYERTLCLLPTHFGHGLICNCLFPWLSGQDLFVLPPFRAELLSDLGRIVDENRITFLSSVPAVWRLALKLSAAPEAGTLRRVHCGSAPLTAHLWRDVQEWSGTGDVFNAYGITETGSWVAGTTLPDFEPEDGLIGRPWGAVVKVLRSSSTEDSPLWAEECGPGESGFVWLNTPALMRGYFGRPDLTRAVVSDGWFFTGDVGRVDDRGRLYLSGRVKEEINKGGMKVHPADVDAVVSRFPATEDVCTFGYEDPLYGENVGVAVVLSEDDGDGLGRLQDWVRERLAAGKRPARWYLVEEIPRTSRGKLNRADVAARCAGLGPGVTSSRPAAERG